MCARQVGGERNKSRRGWLAPAAEQEPACGHRLQRDSSSLLSSSANPSASGLIQLSDLMADSCVTRTETLGQSTKRKASCKRRRSSEVRLAFLQKFHRVTASSCQRCLWAVSALLKACELFKEKLLFCSRISAAAKNKSQHIHASDVAVCVFSHAAARYHRFARLRFMRVLLWSPAVLKVTKGTKGSFAIPVA